MNRIRRSLLACFALTPLHARAHGDGREYNMLERPQPVDAPGKIELTEFFWYGCPHCYKFEPLLEGWVPKLPADVWFRRIPAIFSDRWARDAAIFYTFEALGLVEKLHRPFFDAVHRDRLRSNDAEAFAVWLRRQGIDPARFEQTLKSFGVQARVRRSQQLTVSYRIEGVPTLAVDGRYTIEAERGFEAMLATAEKLIAAARKDLAAAKQPGAVQGLDHQNTTR